MKGERREITVGYLITQTANGEEEMMRTEERRNGSEGRGGERKGEIIGIIREWGELAWAIDVM